LSNISQNNHRIIKNTLALYIRQVVAMVVALFTSRVVLQTLGVTDYGIHNVVGGVVAMFAFISGTLMSITQRFISVELGKGGDVSILRKIFSTSFFLHGIAAVVIVILAETIGLWFVNNKLVIPAERMVATNWIYQFAIFGFVLSLLSAPLKALITAHEDIHIYGYMGIFDVVMRLIMVYLLVIIDADKLIFFALFNFVVSCIVWLFYFFYCKKKYPETGFSFIYDKMLIKELSAFGGFIFIHTVFLVLIGNGITIMLNLFFGPAVNAARGLATAVSMALQSFGKNFRQAITPQITMSCAAGQTVATWNFVERGTRMVYFLLFIFSVPFLLETEFILKLWLGNVPEYTAAFVRLKIIEALLTGLVFGLVTVVNASGKLKTWYSFSFLSFALILIFSYYMARVSNSPLYVLAVLPLVLFLFLPIYIFLAKKLLNLSIKFFIQRVLVPIFFVSLLSLAPLVIINMFFSIIVINPWVNIITSILWTGVVIMLIGLRNNELVKIFAFLKRKIFQV